VLSMLHLIKKDFLIQKKSILFSLFIMIFFSFTLTPMGSGGLTVSILTICYMLVYGAGNQEDKNNSDRMLASLPIRKETIVLSKYISVYVFAAFAFLVNVIIRLAAEALQIPNFSFPVTIEGILGTWAAVTLLFSLSFPMIFKIGYLRSRMANFLVLFAAVFGGTFLMSKWFPEGEVPQLVANYETVLLFAGLVLLLAVSYCISLHFYRNREF
jgi:ABC-type transport system involved in multi-copper enzyme maturation permease subunit